MQPMQRRVRDLRGRPPETNEGSDLPHGIGFPGTASYETGAEVAQEEDDHCACCDHNHGRQGQGAGSGGGLNQPMRIPLSQLSPGFRRQLGIEDEEPAKKERFALGLPGGSVRAIIVILCILSLLAGVCIGLWVGGMQGATTAAAVLSPHTSAGVGYYFGQGGSGGK